MPKTVTKNITSESPTQEQLDWILDRVVAPYLAERSERCDSRHSTARTKSERG